MTHQPFPSVEQLRAKYHDVFSNEAVTAVSLWTDSNSSAATDEAVYLARAMDIGGVLFDQIKSAAESIGNSVNKIAGH
jgi:hypothetical protein